MAKNTYIKGLQYSCELDKIISRLREGRQNERYVKKEIRTKEWLYLRDLTKSIGLIKLLIGMAISVIVFFGGYFGKYFDIGDFLANIGMGITLERVVYAFIVSFILNVILIKSLINEKVKKKMNNLNEKEYFNVDVFKKETPIIWDALFPLMDLYPEFTFKEIKELVEKGISDKEYLSASKFWDNEREKLNRDLDHERKKNEQLRIEQVKLIEDARIFFREKLKPIENKLNITMDIIDELKSKSERYLKGILTDEDLRFIGNYGLYEDIGEKIVLLKNVGLKRKLNKILDKKSEREMFLSKMYRKGNYFNIRGNRILFVFSIKDRTIIMEIELTDYYKEYFQVKNIYMINLLYDVIEISLNIIEKEKEGG